MPKIDFDKFENAKVIETGEGRPKLEAGGYIATITAVRTQWSDSAGRIWTSDEKEYVKLIYDIAEGEHAGIYSDERYLKEDMDWAHWACLSWKGINSDNRRMGMFKGIVKSFNESNPGFDALAALQADKWDLFVGKQVGILLGQEEYENNEGDIAVKMSLPNFRSVATIREGNFTVPELKKLKRDNDNSTSTSTSTSANTSASVPTSRSTDDVPF